MSKTDYCRHLSSRTHSVFSYFRVKYNFIMQKYIVQNWNDTFENKLLGLVWIYKLNPMIAAGRSNRLLNDVAKLPRADYNGSRKRSKQLLY